MAEGGEPSYWIDPGRGNLGYATEASWSLCREAFGTLRMRRVASQALSLNLASLAVLRRLGFGREGRERASVVVRGRPVDMVLFGRLEGELRPLRWDGRGRPTSANARGPPPSTRPGP